MGYFERLKEHPGVPIASVMTVVGGLAGASNESFPILDGFIFGVIVMGGFCWTIVLLSNLKRR